MDDRVSKTYIRMTVKCKQIFNGYYLNDNYIGIGNGNLG